MLEMVAKDKEQIGLEDVVEVARLVLGKGSVVQMRQNSDCFSSILLVSGAGYVSTETWSMPLCSKIYFNKVDCVVGAHGDYKIHNPNPEQLIVVVTKIKKQTPHPRDEVFDLPALF